MSARLLIGKYLVIKDPVRTFGKSWARYSYKLGNQDTWQIGLDVLKTCAVKRSDEK